jgi:hypothetical protein
MREGRSHDRSRQPMKVITESGLVLSQLLSCG